MLREIAGTFMLRNGAQPADFPNLEKIEFNEVRPLSPTQLRLLQGLPKLSVLKLTGMSTGDFEARAFANFPNLRELNLSWTDAPNLPPVSGRDSYFRWLRDEVLDGLPSSVTTINLRGRVIRTSLIAKIPRTVDTLNLGGCMNSAPLHEALRNLPPHLTSLDLSECGEIPADIMQILPRGLRKLTLDGPG